MMFVVGFFGRVFVWFSFLLGFNDVYMWSFVGFYDVYESS